MISHRNVFLTPMRYFCFLTVTFHSPFSTVLPIFSHSFHELKNSELKFNEYTNIYVSHEFYRSNGSPQYVFSNSPFAVLQPISNFRNLVAFGVLLVVSLIELSIAAWITAKYNKNHNFPTSSARAQVRYLLFMSIWTIVFGTVYLVGFLMAASSIFVSVASHFFLCVLSHSTRHLNRSTVFFPNHIFAKCHL